MAIVYQFDKRVGITYAYQSISCRDKVTKQPRSKRTLMGRVDPQTGEIIPTDGRHRGGRKDNSVDLRIFSRKSYGAAYLLDSIGEEPDITEDLIPFLNKNCVNRRLFEACACVAVF
jgi:hypothetical protein